jgi:hypothetical protein
LDGVRGVHVNQRRFFRFRNLQSKSNVRIVRTCFLLFSNKANHNPNLSDGVYKELKIIDVTATRMVDSVVAFLSDPGNVALIFQIIVLFLLLAGVMPPRPRGEKKRLIRHGYLTTIAVVLHTIIILIVMVPSFFSSFEAVEELSILQSLAVWLHAISGITAEILGVMLVALWMFKPPSQMTCAKRKWLMMPTFVIWTFSLILGAVIHITGII